MINIKKSLAVLEKLDRIEVKDPEKYFTTCNDIFENELGTSDPLPTNSSNLSKYTTNMYRILLDIKRSMDQHDECKKEMSTERNVEIFVKSVQSCSKHGLQPYLHPAMMKHKCLSHLYTTSDLSQSAREPDEESNNRLKSGLLAFSELLTIKEFIKQQGSDDVLLVFLAGIFSKFENDSELCRYSLDEVFSLCQEKYFKNLLILKSNQSLPVPLQKMLHKELMKRLMSPNGFEILCKTLIQIGNDEEPIWKKSSAVFDIVARKGHTKAFYSNIIDGIFLFLKKCIKSKEQEVYIDACVGSLSRIYSLGDRDICNKISSLLLGRLDVLCSPTEVITGHIVLDNDEIVEILFSNFMAFCSSVNVTLPSAMLTPYLSVLIQIYSQIKVAHLQNMVSSLIIQCLHNRERLELKSIIDSLLFEDHCDDSKCMHPRIEIKFSSSQNEHSCVISKENEISFDDPSDGLIQILKSSNHNILTYNIFLHLFEQLEDCLESSPQSRPDLIESSDELTQLMSRIFKKRVAIIYTLTELINHKHLQSQFNENPSEVLKICMNIIRNQLTKQQSNPLLNHHVTIMVLSVIKEFLAKIDTATEKFDEIISSLTELRAKSNQAEITHHIDAVLNTLKQTGTFPDPSTSRFNLAKKLCEESAPHLKVYGIMQFIKLIREDKDMETLTNKHAVLAISMICLKDDDSYTFLNCIKLLVALVDVIESQVLEMLIAEYQSIENPVDHRLKIGEVIVKVTEGLGPISYKYKDILINCFLRECTSDINEIRLSSLSNLGGVCRILSYQIHHFFEELMMIIHSVIVNDTYVPARRSAVMVLTDIICGIEHLIDFQEILLPVYKTLRDVVANESDEPTRIHAVLGLKHLNAKIKDFLVPKDSTYKKEIKIFGIKDEGTKLDKSCRFVDMNIK